MPAPREITVGMVQMQCGVDPEANVEKALAMTREAAGRGATIICLPELFRSRYFCQTEDAACFDLAEPIPGPTSNTFASIAKELDVSIIVSVFERRTAGLYHNSVAVVDREAGVLGVYRKMHIPDDPRYYEKYYFTPGDLGYPVFDTRVGRIGALVCWDQWYPEAARLIALRGAQVLFYPTAIGWHPSEKEQYGKAQYDAWKTIQRAHAIANGIYVAAVNRVGFEPALAPGSETPAAEPLSAPAGLGPGLPSGVPGGTPFAKTSSGSPGAPAAAHYPPDPGPPSEPLSRVQSGPGLEFFGGSFICDPFGVVLAEASHNREEILYAKCDPARIEEVRRNWPFLRDRRIDTYGALSSRLIDG
jgi:N-carbamoylputrescine amidase